MVYSYVFTMISVMEGCPPKQAADIYDNIVYYTQPIESNRDRHDKSRKKYKKDRKRKIKKKTKKSYKCNKYKFEHRYNDQEIIHKSWHIQEYQFLEDELIDKEYNQEFSDYIIWCNEQEKISDVLMNEAYEWFEKEKERKKKEIYDKTLNEYIRYRDDIYKWRNFRKEVNFASPDINVVECPVCSTTLDIRFNRICPMCNTCPCGRLNCHHMGNLRYSKLSKINKYSFTPLNKSYVLEENKRKDNRIIKFICKEYCDDKNLEILTDQPMHKYTSIEQVACNLMLRNNWRITSSMCYECGLGPINLSGNKCPLCKYVNKNYNIDNSPTTTFNKWDGSLSTLYVAPIISELNILCILATKCNLPNDICKIIIKNLTKNILFDKYGYQMNYSNHYDTYGKSNNNNKSVYSLVKSIDEEIDLNILEDSELDEYRVSSEEEDNYYDYDDYYYD